MKNKLHLFAVLLFITGSSFATVYTVSVGPSAAPTTFSPSSGITMHPGDTITWVWATGTHTTSSTATIPAGATSWTQPINSSATTYSYVPTITGTYNYQCNIHVSMGMTGSFTVVSPAGIDQANASNPIFRMYPNPVTGSVHIQFNHPGLPVTITLIDMTGKKVIKKTYKILKETDVDLKDIPNGTYTIGAVQGNNAYRQQLIVAH